MAAHAFSRICYAIALIGVTALGVGWYVGNATLAAIGIIVGLPAAILAVRLWCKGRAS